MIIMANHKVPSCILVFLSVFVGRVTTALTITELPLVNECPGDNHWPLTRIENGTVKDQTFLKHGVVNGDGVNDELGVLSLSGSGYVDFKGFDDDCLTSPDRCPNGFTLSFWLKHGGFISSILGLNSKYQKALDTWLSPLVSKNSRWLPCYRASQDGWTGADFHRKCDGKQSTLTIVKVKDYVFGGYLKETWGPSMTVIKDSKAFLFSLSNPQGTAPIILRPELTGKMTAITTSTSLPTFGQNDLVLMDNANTRPESYTTPGSLYKGSSNTSNNLSGDLFTDTKYFIVDEIEVFYNQDIIANREYILTTGAENEAMTGFTIYLYSYNLDLNLMMIMVKTKDKQWIVNVPYYSKEFIHVSITWHPKNVLKVYGNGVLVATGSSSRPSVNTNKKTSMRLGHSWTSRLRSGRNIQMRGLAIWRTLLSVNDINTYMNVACSPLVDNESNSFKWSRTVSTTPTELTGPNTSLPSRGFARDNYVNLLTDSNYAQVALTNANLTEFTACWWSRHDSPSDAKELFKIQRSASESNVFSFTPTKGWQQYCIFYLGSACEYDLFIDGLYQHTEIPPQCFRYEGALTVLIGYLQDSQSRFDGYLSDFNLWDRYLTIRSEMPLVIKSCFMVGGNIITWESLFTKFRSTPKLLPDGICKREMYFIESSYSKTKRQKARLLTSEYVPVTVNCLYFEYNLYGKDIGRLNVFLRKDVNQESLLWSIAGDQGVDQWKSVYISINNTVKSQIIFEGSVGNGYLGDLSISHVALTTTDSCGGGTGKQYTAVKGIKGNTIGHLNGYKETLQGWLRDAELPDSWRTCYRLSSRGWRSSASLHKSCANRGPSITLIRHSNKVFGGVFDRSLWGYGKCDGGSFIPSKKSFLFSLESDAGHNIRLPIKPSASRQAFNCSSYKRYFPNFGNELIVDLTSRKVTGAFGQTYGSSSGTFVDGQVTFTPNDIEILVPTDIFCPAVCPQDTVCNGVQGTCVCDESSRFFESCKAGAFLDNFTSDAYDYFPMNDPSNMKNLRRPVWGHVINSASVIKGVGKSAISTTENDYIAISSTHACLTDPNTCVSLLGLNYMYGVTVSVWMRYSKQIASLPVYLFCSDACRSTFTGFRIALTDIDEELLTVTVTTKTKRCSYIISFGAGVWTHIVITRQHQTSIFINGKNFPINSTVCPLGKYTVNTAGGLIIGKGGAVDVDDLIVWSKVLDSSRVESLYDFYKGRKNMTLEFKFETSSRLTSVDKELLAYKTMSQQVQTGVMKLLSNDMVAKVSVGDCLLRPQADNSGTNVLLSIVYSGMSGYSAAKPLIEQLRTLKQIKASSGRSVPDINITVVLSLDLQTVYSTPCRLSASGKKNNVSLSWSCSQVPSMGILSGYQITVTNLSSGTTETINRTSGNMAYKVTNLLYKTSYRFTVTPMTLEGDGAPSIPVTLTTKSESLTVAPYNVTELRKSRSSIGISWNFSATEIPYIDGFRITYKTSNNMFTSHMTVASNFTEAVISSLNSSTRYSIAVQAYVHDINGPFSGLLKVSTTDGIPNSSPEAVKGSPINSTAVSVTWSPPPGSNNADDPIIGYRVESYIAIGGDAGGNFSTRMTCNHSTILTSLYPFTDYYVNISAFTSNGIGPEIQVYISNQLAAPNQPPGSVRATGEISKTSINITWDPVPAGSSMIPLTGYVIWYREHQATSSSTPNFTIQINESMSGFIDGLKVYTRYDIRVAAFNSAGVGVYSPQIVIRTAEGIPSGVITNVTASMITRNSSMIQWNTLLPSEVQGVLAGYMITIYDVLRNANTTLIVCENKTSEELIDLYPYTKYIVYISAFTSSGGGNASQGSRFLTLEEAPDAPPQNVTSHNTSSESIKITWMVPPITNINGKLRGYYITWFETLGDGQEVFNKTIDVQAARRRKRSASLAPPLTLTLDGLKKYTMYTIRILGFTIANGVFFDTNTTTAEDVPSVPPSSINASNSSSTSISVAWQPVPVEFRHGIVLGYHMFYQKASDMNSPPLTLTVNQSVLNVNLISLNKFTRYIILVAAYTTPGTGNMSSPFNISTDQDVPDEAPVSLTGTCLSLSEVSFSWQPVASDKHNGIILGYNLSLHHVDTSLVKYIAINNASILATEIAGLRSWTNYTAKINAFTVKGSGPWSSGVIVTTLEELPLPPTSVTAQMLSATTTNVTWSPSNTTFLRGILRGYRVTYTPGGSVFPNIASNVTTSVDTLSTVLTGLHEFTEYDIAVSAFTIGDGNQSQPVVAKTDSAPPSGGPSPLGMVASTPHSITLQLGSVSPQDSNGIITRFKVLTTAVGSSDSPKESFYDPTATHAVINGLLPFTHYLFQVAASTDKGWGVPSNTSLRTGETASNGAPGMTRDTKRYSVNAIPLRWTALTPAQASGKVLGYRVTYQLVSLGDEPVEDAPVTEFNVNGTSALIKKLDLYGRYKITIDAFTARGFSPAISILRETCRCRKTLYANWRTYSPYVEVTPETGGLEGIFPQIVKQMTEQCCQTCVAHNESVVEFMTSSDGTPAQKDNEDDLKTNITENVDFSFPLHGTKEQKTYQGGFGYRALVESPGIVYVVNIDTGEQEGPHMTILRSLLGCLPYILLTVLLAYLAGFIMWILDREINPEFFPMAFVKGTYEGLWWAFITMTTLGYGDRFPISFRSKVFAIFWMLSGIVMFGILTSLLQLAVTTITINIDTTFNGKQIVAIHNSPEFRLGQRLNIPMNKETQPKTFQDVYNALITKRAYGAFIDAYAIGQHKELFENPTLKFVKMYSSTSAYGIVLGGTSWRLRTCFYRYLQEKRADVYERIAKYTKAVVEVPAEELPRTVQYSSGLFTPETNAFKYTIFTLLAFWFFLMMLGCVYEVVRRKVARVKDEKIEALEELKKEIQEFVENMKKIQQRLRKKHKLQLREFIKYKTKNEKATIRSLKKFFT